ncbi:3,4-dihydroxy-2-butanone-4-phosphate synthase [Alkalihalobacillus sp. MEB130]|uniref:3,4-dihydroxy-2-butanone-4-phosphate synthase n=1 Tax=Alkalihalobacillus sp. MEB130 TaxID=2976704 RepID=UPI0028EA9AA2|nr:3,4-dihydroxy-2-butanone-4-phosphate synthase [Alkalihalobacillus sp. MEB130]
MFSGISDAIEDLKSGKVIIVVDDENRENEGDMLALADKVSEEMINFMITHGKGLVCAPITKERAEDLELPYMVRNNTEKYKTAFTVSIDHVSNSTGISALDRANTIKALVSKDTKASELIMPGHMFPLIAADGGVLERPGHTEAAIDLAKLGDATPVGVICEVIKENGKMARLPDLVTFAQEYDLKLITIKDLVNYLQEEHQK